MTAFGQYAVESSGSNLEAGMYGAIIESADLVRDENGRPKENQNGKKSVDVFFMVDSENKPRRRFTISYGKNVQSGRYSAFAEFLEAASGVKCGDKTQRDLGPEQLVGKTVRIVIKENENGYMDVSDVLPPGKQVERPKPHPSRFEDEDEMDFPERQ